MERNGTQWGQETGLGPDTQSPTPWGGMTRPLTPTPVSQAEPTGLTAAALPGFRPGPGNAERWLCCSQETKPVTHFQQLWTVILWMNKACFLPRTQRRRNASLTAATLLSHLRVGWRNCFHCKFSGSHEKGKCSPKRSYFFFLQAGPSDYGLNKRSFPNFPSGTWPLNEFIHVDVKQTTCQAGGGFEHGDVWVLSMLWAGWFSRARSRGCIEQEHWAGLKAQDPTLTVWQRLAVVRQGTSVPFHQASCRPVSWPVLLRICSSLQSGQGSTRANQKLLSPRGRETSSHHRVF